MTERAQKITRDTLMPLGVVITLVVCTWAMASDRQQAIEKMSQNTVAIEKNEDEIETIQKSLEYLSRAMLRVEIKLGTQPGET